MSHCRPKPKHSPLDFTELLQSQGLLTFPGKKEMPPFSSVPKEDITHSLCMSFLPDAAGGEQSQIYLSWKNKDGVRLLTPNVSEWIHTGPSCSWEFCPNPPQKTLGFVDLFSI